MKVYVGNLHFDTTEKQVTELLSQFGPVLNMDWVTDRFSGKGKGFCFAEMDNSDADKAIKALNGKEHFGRFLKVNQARPPKQKKRRRRGW